ncbi:hypothetical protein B0T26DRAFT_751960 [Lasiosphaeria miniovina]|uniref:Uncharacterized protein n=1 Tax=Lasiosphaeria miniovina TaxID=1954250 RepID=A0AA40ALC6_9PEZI|nr:uncharacterized protein B0T26DRAFT_751960 [Lasiosphaeria miniovina]KAK0717973.1 hypothetical protein B0T26DRAFT_751960 [Lasiosphaeria miniovina]
MATAATGDGASNALSILKIGRIPGHDNNYKIGKDFKDRMTQTVVGNLIHDHNSANQVNPCAFLYEGKDIPLVVTFKYAFKKSDPPKKETYRLKGTQAGSGGFEIISAPFYVENPTDAAISAVATTFEDFHNTEKAPGSPFRAEGIFKWTLLHNDDKHTPVEHAGTATTSLDFFFMFGPHKVLYDDDHEYHLELIRLVYPEYASVAGKKWSEVEADIIKAAVVNLWKFGANKGSDKALYYDSRGGGLGGIPHHLLGSSLKLSTFFLREKEMVNCFDLAAVLRSMLDSLGRKSEGNVLRPIIKDVTMQSDTPWGYIYSGPLYGWENTIAHNCNSPFW